MTVPIQIPLTKGFFALDDEIDSDIQEFDWYVIDRGKNSPRYAVSRRVKGVVLRMHRVILARILNRPLSAKEIVDHINGDGLDNRRSNLRLVTVAQNAYNQKAMSGSQSGYKGVYVSGKSTWRVSISRAGVTHDLGIFSDKHDAARAYNKKAQELFGDFARLNKIEELI